MPRCSKLSWPPNMVYVLPEPVCPYAMMVPLYPSMKPWSTSSAHSRYTASCGRARGRVSGSEGGGLPRARDARRGARRGAAGSRRAPASRCAARCRSGRTWTPRRCAGRWRRSARASAPPSRSSRPGGCGSPRPRTAPSAACAAPPSPRSSRGGPRCAAGGAPADPPRDAPGPPSSYRARALSPRPPRARLPVHHHGVREARRGSEDRYRVVLSGRPKGTVLAALCV